MIMNNMFLKICILFIPVLLSGCVLNSVRSQPVIISPSALKLFNSTARDGIVRVVIKGNPFNSDKARLDKLITDNFKGAYHGHPTDFAILAEPENATDTRIVVFFLPPKGVSASTICSKPLSVSESEPSRNANVNQLRAISALCREETNLSWAKIWSDMPQSIDDPLLISFIKQTARSTIPPSYMQRSNRDCEFVPTC